MRQQAAVATHSDHHASCAGRAKHSQSISCRQHQYSPWLCPTEMVYRTHGLLARASMMPSFLRDATSSALRDLIHVFLISILTFRATLMYARVPKHYLRNPAALQNIIPGSKCNMPNHQRCSSCYADSGLEKQLPPVLH
jgi:hypothetical protein